MDDKKIKAWMKKNAIEAGQDFFNSLKYELNDLLDDVKKNEKNWQDNMKDKPYPDGDKRDNSLKVNHILFTEDRIRQFNPNIDKAIRAASKITAAFDIEI